jgi:hypothetical protein
LRSSFRGGPMPPDIRDAFERLAQLRAEGASISDAELAAFRAVTTERVSRQAERVMSELDERFRIDGHAETLSATEDDDWLKLQSLLKECDAPSIGDLAPEIADRWARQMAAHARRRGATANSFG